MSEKFTIDGVEVKLGDPIRITNLYDLNWYRKILIFFRLKKLEDYRFKHGIYSVSSVGSSTELWSLERVEENE